MTRICAGLADRDRHAAPAKGDSKGKTSQAATTDAHSLSRADRPGAGASGGDRPGWFRSGRGRPLSIRLTLLARGILVALTAHVDAVLTYGDDCYTW